jgi:hypothetical protein
MPDERGNGGGDGAFFLACDKQKPPPTLLSCRSIYLPQLCALD